MNMINEGIRWNTAMTAGKQALTAKRIVEATRHFMVAERYAQQFESSDIRRGLTRSWMAVGYYKLGSYALAEAFFQEALEILEINLDNSWSAEIARNLMNLVAIYVRQGRKNEALAVQAVVRRHLLEAGWEGSLTLNFEPPAPRSLFELISEPDGEVAARSMSRLFENRKLRSMWQQN